MLGEKIREKRQEKGISLKELAERTQLTPSFLSQVERDLAEPSITSLRKIAEALEVPIFYFLVDRDGHNPVVRRNERRVLSVPQSHLAFELLTPDLERKMEVMMARLEPGAASSDMPLSHPGEEFILVMEGAMDIDIGGEVYHLDEGDSIYYFSSVPHRLISVGEKDLVFLSAITPPRF
ncbi:MAG: cupin domain-containing protein [Firmicutes bacterium]|nr:cupin domain-containing protein [Bacillota bacterium]